MRTLKIKCVYGQDIAPVLIIAKMECRQGGDTVIVRPVYGEDMLRILCWHGSEMQLVF